MPEALTPEEGLRVLYEVATRAMPIGYGMPEFRHPFVDIYDSIRSALHHGRQARAENERMYLEAQRRKQEGE